MNLIKIVAHDDEPQEAAEVLSKKKVIAIGFSKIGNLKGKTKPEIKSLLRRAYAKYRRTDPSRVAGEILDFRDNTRIGDIVFLCETDNTITRVGEIVGDYRFNDKNAIGSTNGFNYPNQKTTRWWGSPFKHFNRTELRDLSLDEFLGLRATIHIIYEPEVRKILPNRKVSNPLAEELRKRLLQKLKSESAKCHRHHKD